MPRTSKFQAKCEAVAEQLDFGVNFFDEDKAKNDAYVDDGTVHIQRGKLRACFDVSNCQNLSGCKQNENTVKLMVALGLPVSSRVLVECSSFEEEEEE